MVASCALALPLLISLWCLLIINLHSAAAQTVTPSPSVAVSVSLSSSPAEPEMVVTCTGNYGNFCEVRDLNCTHLEGDLDDSLLGYCSPSSCVIPGCCDICPVAHLDMLRSISGKITMYRQKYTSLSFGSLEQVGGDFLLLSQSFLTAFNMPALTLIGGGLRFENFHRLSMIRFESLTHVLGGPLEFSMSSGKFMNLIDKQSKSLLEYFLTLVSHSTFTKTKSNVRELLATFCTPLPSSLLSRFTTLS